MSVYGDTLPTPVTRGREMSWTISPPGTPGDDDNSDPFYFNYNGGNQNDCDKHEENNVLSELEESLMLNVKECLLKADTLSIGDVLGNGTL